MAEVDLNALLEGVGGKIGHLVLARRNGKTIARQKGKMTDPKTADQLAVRDVFRKLSLFGQFINTQVLTPHLWPRPKKMTPINRFVKTNTQLFQDKKFEYDKLLIFNGPLYNPGIYTFSLEDAGTNDENVYIRWLNDVGRDDDTAIIIVYDDSRNTGLIAVTDRAAGEINIPTGLLRPAVPSKIHAYLVFSRPPQKTTKEKGQVSGTAYAHL